MLVRVRSAYSNNFLFPQIQKIYCNVVTLIIVFQKVKVFLCHEMNEVTVVIRPFQKFNVSESVSVTVALKV